MSYVIYDSMSNIEQDICKQYSENLFFAEAVHQIKDSFYA